MKQKKLIYLLISVLGVWSLALSSPFTAHAAEDGGAVQTNGVISFYEEVRSSSEEPPASSSSTEPASTTQSSATSVTKPTGKYPSTGELMKKSLSISGITLVLIAVGFFFLRSRREKGDPS